jgi:hypothetical protein
MDPHLVTLLESARRLAAAIHPALTLTAVLLEFGRERIRFSVTLAPAGASGPDPPSHSLDFRSARVGGVSYSFTPNQATIVKALWEAWERGAPDVGQETLLELADSDNNRLRDLFRANNRLHPAWGTLIVPGASRGTFCLAIR